MTPEKRALACDGPRNGEYITPKEAQMHGYELTQWPSGEYVYMTVIGDAHDR
jgi:hypothetical protein